MAKLEAQSGQHKWDCAQKSMHFNLGIRIRERADLIDLNRPSGAAINVTTQRPKLATRYINV